MLSNMIHVRTQSFELKKRNLEIKIKALQKDHEQALKRNATLEGLLGVFQDCIVRVCTKREQTELQIADLRRRNRELIDALQKHEESQHVQVTFINLFFFFFLRNGFTS